MPVSVATICADPNVFPHDPGHGWGWQKEVEKRDAFSPKEYGSSWGNQVSAPGDSRHETLPKVTNLLYPSFRRELKFPDFLRDLATTYLLRHWKNLKPDSLRKKVIFHCTQAWPKYSLGDQEC
jgi:hypothetical protein